MKKNNAQYEANNKLILFCGLPGTLKTFLSVKLSGKLGYAYLPTRAVGEIKSAGNAALLQQSRIARYKKLAEVVDAAFSLGANIVVDGGFATSPARRIVLKNKQPGNVIIIHCTASAINKIQRLQVRAADISDYEKESAKDILHTVQHTKAAMVEEDPVAELSQGNVSAVLKVDTSKSTLQWKGKPDKKLKTTISNFITLFLQDYERMTTADHAQELTTHFDDLAATYDGSTEWRSDDKILQSLQLKNIKKKSRVLDIGAGTGLASEWYAKKGHDVVGIDISPQMLQKASERLTFVLLANATQLPFINNYFDVAIVRQCLHYVEPLRLLKEAGRTIKKGGLLAVSGAVCPDEKTKNFWREFKNATQPLRLEVFTAADIEVLLKTAGFTVTKKIEHSITRKETLRSIEKRSAPIAGGTSSFLKNMHQLTTTLFPKLGFEFKNEVLTYKQYWVTIWAEKR